MMKKKLFPAVCAVLFLFLFALPVFAQSATLHVILVGDTKCPNIGRGDQLDLDLMTALVRDASKNTGMRLNLKVFDTSIERPAVMSAVHTLSSGSNDTVLFYYTGHGYRMNSMRTKWPAMALKDRGRTAGLDQKWVFDTLKAKNPRLLLVMTDACNNVVADGAIDTKIALRSGKELKESYVKLFMKDSGTMISSSSIPGQYSYSGNTGSQFTVAFIDTIRSALATPNPSWQSIMQKTSRPLYGGRQQPQFEFAAGSSSGGDSSPPEDYTPASDEGTGPEGDESTGPEGDEYCGGESEYPAMDEDTELGLANLLVEMETNILYSAQSSQWPGLRNNWIQKAMGSSSNLPQMKNVLIDFEKHMKSQGMSSSWAGQKSSWLNSVRSASSINQLAGSLAVVEKGIGNNAWAPNWGAKRSQWQEKVARLDSPGGSVDPDPPTGAPIDGGSSGGGGGAFGNLLIELDGSMLSSAMKSSWSGMQNGWRSQVSGAGSDLSRIKNLLIQFEGQIGDDSMESYWNGRRGDWASRVRSASSVSALADLMLEFERSISFAAQNQNWVQRRPGWVNQVQSQ